MWTSARLRSPFYRQQVTSPDFVRLERPSSDWYLETTDISDADRRQNNGLLFQAIRTYDQKLLVMSLEAGASPDARNSDNTSALAFAIELDNVQAATVLLQFAANAKSIDDRGVTVLFQAAARGQTPLIQLLIERGAIIDAPSTFPSDMWSSSDMRSHGRRVCTALDAAVWNGHTATAQLLAGVASVNILRDSYGSALENAIQKDDHPMLRLLLDQLASVPSKDLVESRYFDRALQASAAKGNLSVVKRLLSYLKSSQPEGHGLAICNAYLKCHLETAKVLADNAKTARIKIKRKEFFATVRKAVLDDDAKMVEFLLDWEVLQKSKRWKAQLREIMAPKLRKEGVRNKAIDLLLIR